MAINYLNEVKKRLLISSSNTYHDEMLNAFINDVKHYMLGAGVSEVDMETDKVVGVVCRGVFDLWNMGAGDGKFSELFKESVIQLIVGGSDV